MITNVVLYEDHEDHENHEDHLNIGLATPERREHFPPKLPAAASPRKVRESPGGQQLRSCPWLAKGWGYEH